MTDAKKEYRQLIAVGVAIAKEIERRGVSNKEVARMAGISRTSLTKILDCEANYSIKTLLKVLNAMGMELSVWDKSHADNL